MKKIGLYTPAIFIFFLVSSNISMSFSGNGYTEGSSIPFFNTGDYSTASLPAYTNKQAPKGGKIRIGLIGHFNPHPKNKNKNIVETSQQLGLAYDSLLVRSPNALTYNGLIANHIKWSNDASWVEFDIDPRARFHNGQLVTPEDVKCSFDTIKQTYPSQWQYPLPEVAEIKIIGDKKIRFNFYKKHANNQQIIALGELPIFSCTEPLLDAWPTGSGPYQIQSSSQEDILSLVRDKNYWAKEHPINQGLYNIDEINFLYFPTEVAMKQGFVNKMFDLCKVSNLNDWYENFGDKKNTLQKIVIPRSGATGTFGIIFNMSNPLFNSDALRKAINYAMDYEKVNIEKLYSHYERSLSFFNKEDWNGNYLPDKYELSILTPIRKQLPSSIFTRPFKLPLSDSPAAVEKNLTAAKLLLKSDGFYIEKNKLYNKYHQPIVLTFPLIDVKPLAEVTENFIDNLQRLGITCKVQLLPPKKFKAMLTNRQYDMTIHYFMQTNDPIADQFNFWHSTSADNPLKKNYINLKSPEIDQLIEQLKGAKNQLELNRLLRCLDRVLLHGNYMVPLHRYKTMNIVSHNPIGVPTIKCNTAYEDIRKYKIHPSWWIQSVK